MQRIWTSEVGIASPDGLAFDPVRQQFLVVSKTRMGVEILRLGSDAEDWGVVTVPGVDAAGAVAFDVAADELVMLNGAGGTAISGQGLDTAVALDERTGSSVLGLEVASPTSATFHPDNGSMLVLDGSNDELVRVDGGNVTRQTLDAIDAPELIAANPEDGLVYVMSPTSNELVGVDGQGEIGAAFDLEGVELGDPVAMVFAPSSDPTDSETAYNLFVADTGGTSTSGSIFELTLTTAAALAVPTEEALLVRTTATSAWSPGAPDPSGIAYIASAERLLVVDSEVDEVTGAGWNDVNVWTTTFAGSVTDTGTFWGPQAGSFEGVAGFSREPTGADFDNGSGRLFVSDDQTRQVYIVKAGVDGQFGTPDDDVSAFDTDALGSTDTEDPVYDPVSGDLFVLDGVGREIYRVDSVDGVFGNGDDTFTQFDISGLGPTDFEGLTRDPVSGNLYVGARSTDQIFEITDAGTLIRVISVDGFNGLRYVSGLQMAPSSIDPSTYSMYIVDRGADNGGDPTENDGEIFEAMISAPPVGSPPNASDDVASTEQDTPVVIPVAANDTDPDGDLVPSSAATQNSPTSGSTSANGDGTITYTPDPGFAGSDVFTYIICDAASFCSSAAVTVTVSDRPDPPNAVNDSASTDEGLVVTIDVVANDDDPDGDLDVSSVSIQTAPSFGTAFANADGAIVYTPDPGFSGIDTLTYQVCDLASACDAATVTIAVGGVQKWYVSLSSTETIPEIVGDVKDEDLIVFDPLTGVWEMFFDASDVGITSSDLDAFHVRPDGSVLISYSSDGLVIPGLAGGPAGESIDESDLILFTPTSVGDSTAGSFDFYIDGSDVGLTGSGDDIDGLYEFTDGRLAISVTGSPTLGSLSGDDSDVFVFAPATTGSDTTGTWTELYFDASDIGLVSASDDLVGVSFDLNGDLFYVTVGANSVPGSADEDVNRFSGTFGAGTSGQATLEVDMSTLGLPDTGNVDGLHAGFGTSSGDAPVAVGDVVSTLEDTAVVVDVAANDSDPDDGLDVSSVSVTVAAVSGVAVGNGDGTITYTPNADFAGSDGFSYQICDLGGLCASASVSVSVDPVNDAPVAVGDVVSTLEDTAVVVDVAANDSDPDDGLDVSSVSVTVAAVSGVAVGNGDGTITYTPNADFAGSDGFSYQICDLGGLCASASVSVSVDPVNDAPVAVGDVVSTLEDTAVVVDVAANDSDPDDGLDVSSVSVTVAAVSGVAVGNGDGTITYTPNADFAGSDGFSYQICDLGGLCASASVSVSVDPVNDAPVAVGDVVSTLEDTAVVVDVAANDSDPDDGLDVSSVSVTVAAVSGVAVGNGDGTITYTPNADFAGSDGFSYQICDLGGLCASASVSVSVSVDPVNDAPVAVGDVVSTLEDTAVVVDVAANDSDPDDGLDVSSVSVTVAAVSGVAVGNGDGTITYTPNADFAGSDGFSYQICDLGGLCASASVSVSVDPVNDAPVAVGDVVSTLEDTAVVVDVAANDSDPDDGLDVSSVSVTVAAVSGVAVGNGDGTITYTPNADFAGSDGFSYQICDLGGLCASASVSVSVDPVNDAPVVSITQPVDGTVVFTGSNLTFSATAIDVEDGDLGSTVTWMSSVDGGLGSGSTVVAMLSGGSPAVVHSVTATVTDGEGTTIVAAITVRVRDEATSMSIGALIGTSVKGDRGTWDATVMVTVLDDLGEPVAGATVSGTWSAGATGTGSCTTDSTGTCIVFKAGTKKKTKSLTFTVSAVSGPLPYDSGANAQTSVTVESP